MGRDQLNRAARILANEPLQNVPSVRSGQITDFTYIPPTLK